MLSVVMLSVVKQSVVLLSVVAPHFSSSFFVVVLLFSFLIQSVIRVSVIVIKCNSAFDSQRNATARVTFLLSC